ncbi:CpaE family protein [Microbacterium sp. R86528]|uniref:CpaE family protein n=1 Tax=Microbacterium sp. R86528 TaxID=3093864 RepID=UPI0037C69895
MNVVVAVDGGEALSAGLTREGYEVTTTAEARALAEVAGDALLGDESESLLRAVLAADAVVLEVRRDSLTAEVVALCDRAATRILPLCADDSDERVAAVFGLEQSLGANATPRLVAEALAAQPRSVVETADAREAPRVIAVWGAPGAPGRSTVAIELATELARGGKHVALVDADTHAPSIALTLGIADEGPGFAAACRQAELGGLDEKELTRISIPLGRTGVDVLTGLNRPSRWPELSEKRVAKALELCRSWADFTVVDVSSSLERDEEIVSDLEGPRRNAATLAALRCADVVVAVAGADPIGISRFLRAHADLRATIGGTTVRVVANKVRPGALGIDARGQIRRTLERFGGIRDVWFLPLDARAADAALLASRTIAEQSPKSPLVLGVRRFVGDVLVPPPATVAASRRVTRRYTKTAA